MWPSAPVLLLVAIAVEGGDEEAAARVVSGCEAALGPQECTVKSESAATAEPLSATVSIEDGSVAVSVVAKGGEHAERRLEFGPEDGTAQRAVAAGLLVAALAADLERTAAARVAPSPAVRPPPAPEPRVIPDSAPRPEARARLWLLDVGVLASPPLGALAVHLGGQAQVGYFPTAGFALFFGARGDAALPGGLDASRLGLSLGAGLELLPRARELSLLGIVDGRIEELRLGGGLSEPRQAAVLRGGGAVSARLGLPTGGAGFYAGLEAAVMGPEVAVFVGTEPVGQVPLLSFSLLLGGRLASFRP